MAALEWLDKPWFYSVLGNHEVHHILCFGRTSLMPEWQSFFIPGEDLWIYEQDEAQYESLVTKIAELPTAITVETAGGPVGLVHASLPHHFETWLEFTQAMDAGKVGVDSLYEAAWSRCFVLNESASHKHAEHIVGDVVALFHGHNIPCKKLPFPVGNRHHIETGAFLRRRTGFGGFTLVDISDTSQPILEAYWPASR